VGGGEGGGKGDGGGGTMNLKREVENRDVNARSLKNKQGGFRKKEDTTWRGRIGAGGNRKVYGPLHKKEK